MRKSKPLFLGHSAIDTIDEAQKAATNMAENGNYPAGLDHCFVAGINGVFHDPDGICNFYAQDPAMCVCPQDVKDVFVEILDKRATLQKGKVS